MPAVRWQPPRLPYPIWQVIANTDIFWASHGAGMVHLPLLPPAAVAIEMFNCGHFSYLYANLALNLGVRYFLMQRLEPYCYRPQARALSLSPSLSYLAT